MQLKSKRPYESVLCHVEQCRQPYEIQYQPFKRATHPNVTLRLCDKHNKEYCRLEAAARQPAAPEVAPEVVPVDAPAQGGETQAA